MKWADEMRIETPEQIELDVELAGVGSRFMAQFIDWLLKFLFSVLLVLLAAMIVALLGGARMVENPSDMLMAVVVAVLYLLWLGYGVYYEVRWSGQTPGKYYAGIRVVRDGGAPLDLRAAGVRNLLAFADFLPIFFILGAVLILLTARRQRLGDMAAGTVVVRERVAELGPDPSANLAEFASDDYRFTAAQLAALAPADRNIIREFLVRYDDMDRGGRRRLALKMADTYAGKTGYVVVDGMDGADAVAFLGSLLRDLEEARRHG